MRNEPKVKLTEYHEPLDGGVLVRMKPKTSGTLSRPIRCGQVLESEIEEDKP